VVGYHKLSSEDRQHFEEFFANAIVLAVSEAVLLRAAQLRQVKKMSVGDVIVAATALHYQHTLVTRNHRDFDWIAGLQVLNPFDSEVGTDGR
jgi:predicted nucleic acid-binding protein